MPAASAAIGRSALFKVRAATLSGAILLALGVGVLVEVGRRLIYGAEPLSEWMIGTALLSLVVNLTVLRLLAPMKSGEDKRLRRRHRLRGGHGGGAGTAGSGRRAQERDV